MLWFDNSTNSGHHEYEYTYDKVGNRATMAVTNGGGTEMHVYSYDTNGKGLPNAMDRVWEPNMTYDGANTYGYDPENRLTTVEKVPEPLAVACDIALTFTTGGAANWFSQTAEIQDLTNTA